mmetsp:Transcript_15446/g.23473  ORF Transcript_15446/g.23473 Transcript_15446/m.23473 type:complete len:103 (+) Transcript_15446:688-996(+)
MSRESNARPGHPDCKEINSYGDWRLLNMVFASEKTTETSKLIVYDFGGPITEASPIYPKGVRASMQDGHRNGKDRQIITKSDAVYSLMQAFHKVIWEGRTSS